MRLQFLGKRRFGITEEEILSRYDGEGTRSGVVALTHAEHEELVDLLDAHLIDRAGSPLSAERHDLRLHRIGSLPFGDGQVKHHHMKQTAEQMASLHDRVYLFRHGDHSGYMAIDTDPPKVRYLDSWD